MTVGKSSVAISKDVDSTTVTIKLSPQNLCNNLYLFPALIDATYPF